MQLFDGQVLADRYRVRRRLGHGAMGTVYEAEELPLHRRVAIKLFRASIVARADALARFEQEARAAGRLGSEHIVQVHGAGDLPEGGRYLVMEYCEGVTLADRIRARGRLSPAEATPIVHQLLEGLAVAHDAGMIHGNLKPANVSLLAEHREQRDFVKIFDFGVSKFSQQATEETRMAVADAVQGMPFYMSLEQAQGAQIVDARSDLYAVGVILFECVTGHVPFFAETFNELIFKIILETPPPLESYAPDLDPRFAALVRRAMSRRPGERFQSAREFQQALAPWITPRSTRVATNAAPQAHAAPVPGGPGIEEPSALEHAWAPPESQPGEALLPSLLRSDARSSWVVSILAFLIVVLSGSLILVLSQDSRGFERITRADPPPETAAVAASPAPSAASSEAPPSDPDGALLSEPIEISLEEPEDASFVSTSSRRSVRPSPRRAPAPAPSASASASAPAPAPAPSGARRISGDL